MFCVFSFLANRPIYELYYRLATEYNDGLLLTVVFPDPVRPKTLLTL